MTSNDPKLLKMNDLPDYVVDEADAMLEKMLKALEPITHGHKFSMILNCLSYVLGCYISNYLEMIPETEIKKDAERMISTIKASINSFYGKNIFEDET